jgi:hypothetical protein
VDITTEEEDRGQDKFEFQNDLIQINADDDSEPVNLMKSNHIKPAENVIKIGPHKTF